MRALLILLLTAPALLVGCSTPNPLLETQRQTIDSLYVADREMRVELYALQDSIRFFDDIQSGRYYRQQRALEDEINRLEYLVAVRQDSLCLTEDQTIETLLVDDLFEPASATLTEAGIGRLAELATLIKDSYPGRNVRIEGHSDSVPPGGTLQERYPTNWELTAARATAVVRYLADEQEMEATRFEAVSYGPARPMASNSTASGRRLNRRINVIMLDS